MSFRTGRIVLSFLFGVLLFNLSSCVSKPLLEEQPAPFGKDACLESPLVGSWKAGEDTFTFGPDCAGTSTNCRSKFLFPPNIAQAGVVNIQVLESDGPEGCLKKGTHRCSVSVLTNSATLNCGSGSLQLSRF